MGQGERDARSVTEQRPEERRRMSSIEATRPSAALSCGTWTIDPAHSCVGFRVTHLGLTDVRGRFADFCGSLVVTAKGAIDAEGTVTAVSIDTGQPQRDDHLRGPEFLDAATHPQISFRSTMFEPLGQGTFRVTGDLTIHGVTREVALDAEISGTEQDPWGNTRVGLAVSGKIDRADYGLDYGPLLESGGLLIGRTITLSIDISAVRQG